MEKLLLFINFYLSSVVTSVPMMVEIVDSMGDRIVLFTFVLMDQYGSAFSMP